MSPPLLTLTDEDRDYMRAAYLRMGPAPREPRRGLSNQSAPRCPSCRHVVTRHADGSCNASTNGHGRCGCTLAAKAARS